jgi:serine protease Do
MIRTVDGNLAREKDLGVLQGVWVDSLMENSAAAASGVLQGDIITHVNGLEVKSSPELQGIIARYRPGEKVTLTLERNGKQKEIDVVLNNRNGTQKMATQERSEILNSLGVEFQTLEADAAKKLDISGGVKVARLYAGKLKRQTDMQEGFIITKVDGKPVKKAEELTRILESKKGGVMLEGVYEDFPGTYYYAFGIEN